MNRLGDIAKRFSNEKLFISMNTYHELSKLHINTKLIEQFKELQSASYAELKQLHNSVLESGLKFDTEILTKNWNQLNHGLTRVGINSVQLKLLLH